MVARGDLGFPNCDHLMDALGKIGQKAAVGNRIVSAVMVHSPLSIALVCTPSDYPGSFNSLRHSAMSRGAVFAVFAVLLTLEVFLTTTCSVTTKSIIFIIMELVAFDFVPNTAWIIIIPDSIHHHQTDSES